MGVNVGVHVYVSEGILNCVYRRLQWETCEITVEGGGYSVLLMGERAE